jgi:hypothetical protein
MLAARKFFVERPVAETVLQLLTVDPGLLPSCLAGENGQFPHFKPSASKSALPAPKKP